MGSDQVEHVDHPSQTKLLDCKCAQSGNLEQQIGEECSPLTETLIMMLAQIMVTSPMHHYQGGLILEENQRLCWFQDSHSGSKNSGQCEEDFAIQVCKYHGRTELSKIHERIMENKVNTLEAKKLYSLAGDWARLGPNTLLFGVCCGTGTIGLNLANRVGMVVGIEMNASAVADAKRNAEINGIKNYWFICSMRM